MTHSNKECTDFRVLLLSVPVSGIIKTEEL